MSETRGVFGLEDIIEQKLENEWVLLEDVWLEPSFPGTGYFGGGFAPTATGRTSSMEKTTYASDTTAAVPGANLTAEVSEFAGTGNSTHGYFGGGRNPSTTAQMDKVTYASDTTAAVPGANLTAARYLLAATGNSTHGYFGGGRPGSFSTMDKTTYSSDTTAAVPGANLSAARHALAASSSRANALPTTSSSSTPVIV